VRTNVVALLIFLPIILRCFLLNVNNTFEDDDENDVGVGVDVAIQQKKSLEQTPPVLGPSGRGINRAHKKKRPQSHAISLSLSLSLGGVNDGEEGADRATNIPLKWRDFGFSPCKGKNGFSFECHMCSHFFSTRQTAQKDDVERRGGRGKQRVVEVVSKRRRVFGRRVSRCRGGTRASEIEFERCEILVRSEYGDEKVD
jgi:hypothetical protein